MSAPAAARQPTPRERLKAELARYIPSYENLLPQGYSPERLVTGALLAATRNPDLMKCTTQSIAVALAQVAQWNLDVGTTAHLVPFGAVCTAVADYKGYIELMCKAGAQKVEAHVVREGETFAMQRGTEPFLRHVPSGTDAPIIAAYAIVWFRGGVTQFEVMTLAEIEAIRQSKSKSWKSGPLPKWYARKTVIRQLAKYVPKTPALARLLEEDDVEPIEGEATPEMLATIHSRERPAHVQIPLVSTGADPYGPPRQLAAVDREAADLEEDRRLAVIEHGDAGEDTGP